MGNKNTKTVSYEQKETSEWKLKHIPLSNYSQPVLLNDGNIVIVPENIGHSDDHRYIMLYDSKTNKYNIKWIKIKKYCKISHNVCFSNNGKSTVYMLGGLWDCFLEIDAQKKKMIEYIKYDLQCEQMCEKYNYQHPGSYPMIAMEQDLIHIIGGTKSSKHIQFDTCSEQIQFKTVCQSLFNGDKDASYYAGGVVYNKLSRNLIAFGGKRNDDFLKRIWIGKKMNDCWIWNRSRGSDLPVKLHLFAYILMESVVVIFGGKGYDGNPCDAILYCRLQKNDDAIQFKKLKSLTCPFSGQCFAVLDDINNKIHLFFQKYHYTISCELLTNFIEEQHEEKTELPTIEQKQTESDMKQENTDVVTNPLVILLGIKTYDESTKLKDLQGTKLDIQAYKSCFENEYNYKVICQDKYKWVGDEIKDFFIDARKHLVDPQNESRGLHDGLIIVIAGHGHKDVFIQSDGISREINYYHAFFSSVWSDVISRLKIRLFIIDCCRGDIKDGTVKYHNYNDPFNIKSTRGQTHQHIDNLLVSIYGNSAGHEVGEDENGGLFSQSLIEALKQKDARMPLNRLLKSVKEDLYLINDESDHSQLVTTEGDQDALFCVLAPKS